MPRQGPPADRRHRRPRFSERSRTLKRPGAFTFARVAGERRRPDPALGVFETLRCARRAGATRGAPRAAARSVRELYGEELPEVEMPDCRRGGADRLRARAAASTVEPRAAARRGRCRSCSRRTCCPAGSASTSGSTGGCRRARDGRRRCCSTPTARCSRRRGRACWSSATGGCYTPREDGRILPSTSRPGRDADRPAARSPATSCCSARRSRESCRPCSRPPARHRAPVGVVLRPRTAA